MADRRVNDHEETPMRRPNFLPLMPFLAVLALALPAPAAADAPVKVSSIDTSGPFVDDETCTFTITTTVERRRTIFTFADGDVRRHTHLVVATSANGKTLVERDAFSVSVDSESPDVWIITGAFTHARLLGGGTVALRSGRILYDVHADQILDPRPGPHRTDPADVVCDLLSA